MAPPRLRGLCITSEPIQRAQQICWILIQGVLRNEKDAQLLVLGSIGLTVQTVININAPITAMPAPENNA